MTTTPTPELMPEEIEYVAKAMAFAKVGDPNALDRNEKPRWKWYLEDAEKFVELFGKARTTTQPELLSCPFCGDTNPCEQWTGGGDVHIECMNCHVYLPYGGANMDKCGSEAAAVEMARKNWNTRATPARVAELEEERDTWKKIAEVHTEKLIEEQKGRIALQSEIARKDKALVDLVGELEYDISNGNVALEIARAALEGQKDGGG